MSLDSRAASLLKRKRESGESLSQAHEALSAQLDRALQDFLSGEHNGEALARFCDRIVKEGRRAEWPGGMDAFRHAEVGRYLEAALDRRRTAGRPAVPRERAFIHAWHMINLDREASGQPILTGKVPAREIALVCADFGLLVTPRQVSDALRLGKRTIACPYYGEKAAD